MSTTLSKPSGETTPAPSGKGPTRAKSSGWFSAQHKLAPYVFVSPFVIMFSIFGIYPIIKSIMLAFYATNGPKSQVYVGFNNFNFMFHHHDFQIAVRNTIIYTLCSVFLQLPCALGLAILLNQKWLKGHSFLRLAFYSPNLMGTVYVGILFQQLFSVHYGLVNRVLASIIPGFSTDFKWLGDPQNVMPALVLTSLWLYVGYNMVYFLAGLQAVDKELYEAAEVDGANAWQRFWAVTVPSIKPIATFVLVTSTIGSFQFFDLPYIMLGNGGGPNNAGLTIVMYLYQQGFITGDLGYASAVGWTLAIGVLAISLLQMKLTGSMKGND